MHKSYTKGGSKYHMETSLQVRVQVRCDEFGRMSRREAYKECLVEW